jgi:hypothetical protein
VNPTLFTVAGCAKCRIVKQFLLDKHMPFETQDLNVEGRANFKQFYAANRSRISRGAQGIALPVFYDGDVVLQGVGAIVSYAQARGKLDGFLGHSELSRDWVSGIHLSRGNPDHAQDLLAVLRYFKQAGLKIHLSADGHHAGLLSAIADESLAHRLSMEIAGPAALYECLSNAAILPEALGKSIRSAITFPDYRLFTELRPFFRDKAAQAPGYLTTSETAQVAAFIEEVSGSKKHPYYLVGCNPADLADERLKNSTVLTQQDMFRYRTAARRYQVFTEVRDRAFVMYST